MREKLTHNQQIFVAEYLKDRNATQAAIRAGYSEHTANEQGSRLLANVSVRHAINGGIQKLEKKCEITAEKVLKRLWRIANADLAQFYDRNGNLKNVHDIPKTHRFALMGIEIDEIWNGLGQDRIRTGETKKIKIADKIRALELLGRHLKMFTDNVEITENTSIADRMKAGRLRVKKVCGGEESN
jgi:phage terminase small subunit